MTERHFGSWSEDALVVKLARAAGCTPYTVHVNAQKLRRLLEGSA